MKKTIILNSTLSLLLLTMILLINHRTYKLKQEIVNKNEIIELIEKTIQKEENENNYIKINISHDDYLQFYTLDYKSKYTSRIDILDNEKYEHHAVIILGKCLKKEPEKQELLNFYCRENDMIYNYEIRKKHIYITSFDINYFNEE